MNSALSHRVLCGYSKNKAKSRCKNIYKSEGVIPNNVRFNQHQERKLESRNALMGEMKKKCQRKILLNWDLMQMDSYQ